MNVQEFAELKAGDKIENPATDSRGEVSRITGTGVYVVWGKRHKDEREFFFSAVGTAWFSWVGVEHDEKKSDEAGAVSS